MSSDPDLIASYWTIAGAVRPGAGDEVSPIPFEERVAVAAAAGWRGVGIRHGDLSATAQRLGGIRNIRRVLEDNGTQHVELELLSGWAATGGVRAASDRKRQELLEAAGELGACCIKVIGQFTDGPTSVASGAGAGLSEAFAELCQHAAGFGTAVAIEFMPFTDIPDIRTALEIVAAASEPNGGIYIDIWHVARGNMSLADVAAVPKRFIKGVELGDADTAVVGTLREDSANNRRLCGQGQLEISGFLRAIALTGFSGPFGVEVLSERQRGLPLEVAAREAFTTTAAQFSLRADPTDPLPVSAYVLG